MKKRIAGVVAIAAAMSGISTVHAQGRDTVSIVGSSTVYPFATIVAERFGRSTSFKTPKIESTGSGGGLKLFCKGVGAQTPDITNSSRRIKKSEYDDCQANGVTDIVEVLVGYDGIALANSKQAPRLELSRKDLYMALAKDVPAGDGSGKLVVSVRNDTPVQVQGIQVAVSYSDASGAQQRRFSISGQVPPGQIASVNTGMGPYTSSSGCPAQVVAAEVVE